MAKENVVKKLQEAFGEDWIGESNKKFYVWAKDEIGKAQIAITLTCPKTEISVVETGKLDYGSKGIDFEAMSAADTVIVDPEPAELTEEEEKNIADLMAALGL